MGRLINQFDSPPERPDPGPGIGPGFGIGVIVYIVLWYVVGIIFHSVFPIYRFRTLMFSTLVAYLFISGVLIWISLATHRERFAKGIIVCASVMVLLVCACWGIAG